MTQVDFHLNVQGKLAYACRFARKAYGQGARMVFYAGDDAVLADFDRLLWTFSAADFLPHVRVDDRLAPVTPIHLAGRDDADRCLHHDLLINLDREQPAFFSRFERLIELVDTDVDDVEAGRARWKFYRDRGYPLSRHEAGARTPAPTGDS